MNKQLIILLVVAVLVLSAGPLTYLLSHRGEEVINYEPKKEKSPEFYKMSAYINASVVDTGDSLAFTFVSTLGNKNIIQERIANSTSTNASLSMTLNPYGPGYQYKVEVPIDSKTNTLRLGFLLAYDLSDYIDWRQSNLPIMLGKVKLPDKFKARTKEGSKTVKSSNETIAAILLYSKRKNDTVQLFCDNIMTTTVNYKLIGVQSLCYDTDLINLKPYLGLPVSLASAGNESAKILNVTLKQITNATIIGSYDASLNISEDDFYNALRFNDSFGIALDIIPPTANRTAFSITFTAPMNSSNNSISHETLMRIKQHFESFAERNEIKILNEYSIGEVLLPSYVTLNGIRYKVPSETMTMSLPFTAIPGNTFNKNIYFNIVYGRIVNYRTN
ncbi:hypothetical protein DRN74_01030 [Candidatus Micrarchaeota archaeon]|nr:MAG: hypothetical protein DRN74_01030 [Candidatus Micrarchaeota archaeon]